MNTNQNLFQQGQLAEASYANLAGISVSTDPELLKTRLINLQPDGTYDFSTTQATEFVTHWKVISHQPDQPSGFSATLFDSLDQPGQYTLAIRGTAGVQDLLVADGLDIVADGLAMDQIVDLYNFWKKLTAPQGGQYQIANLATLETETNQLQAAYALGVVAGLAYEAVLRTRSDIVIDSPSKRVRTVQYATLNVGLSSGRVLRWS